MAQAHGRRTLTVELPTLLAAEVKAKTHLSSSSLAALLVAGAVTTGILPLNHVPPGLLRKRVERLLTRATAQRATTTHAPTPQNADHDPDPDWDNEEQFADEN